MSKGRITFRVESGVRIRRAAFAILALTACDDAPAGSRSRGSERLSDAPARPTAAPSAPSPSAAPPPTVVAVPPPPASAPPFDKCVTASDCACGRPIAASILPDLCELGTKKDVDPKAPCKGGCKPPSPLMQMGCNPVGRCAWERIPGTCATPDDCVASSPNCDSCLKQTKDGECLAGCTTCAGAFVYQCIGGKCSTRFSPGIE